ncbi:MAG: TIGR02677 family protein [Clostridiaceae bacterium]
MDRNITRSIEESKYLATENTWRYRAIIRFIYKAYEKMKYWVYKEEIFSALKAYEDFQEYTLDNLKGDLDSLVNWGNLTAIADTAKVTTIEEFKNREFRYQLSTITLEFERMLINLEHMKIENTATLEAALVEKFRHQLEEDYKGKEERDLYEWWKDLNSSFQELNRNYQDYISKFYSPKNDEIMKTTEFLIYKEGFVKYLREFIRTLQLNAIEIRNTLGNISDHEVSELISRVLSYEKKIQSLDVNIDETEYRELNLGRFNSIREWFIPSKGRPALVEQLIDNTNEVIRKMTRYAAAIADKKNNHANRKEEYRKLALLFKDCKDITEAHKLSAMIFGSTTIVKVLASEERETENINSSIYEEFPREYIIKPKIRSYREKVIKNPIPNNKERKQQKLKKILEKREGEQKALNKYINNGEIDFQKLPVIPPEDRLLLLRMIALGQSKKKKWIASDSNITYRVEKLEDSGDITLSCEDGSLIMPHYKIIIKEG